MRDRPGLQTGHGGFTLIELLVSVAITGILLAVGIPSFQGFILNQRVKTASYDLSSTLILARSEAIKRNATVSLVPTSTTAWASGWTVTTGGATLSTQEAYPNITIGGPGANVSYGGDGRINSGSAPAFSIAAGTSSQRCIKVDLSGLPNSKTGACS